MKSYILFLSAVLCIYTGQCYAQISIASARSMSLGSIVTVNGIVTTDAGFGTIRYIQDGTSGIAIFDSQLSGTTRGDSISVTGELDEFQNLLEIVNVSSFTVISSSNPLPAPVVITPSMCDESMEGQLVSINAATFNSPVGNFSGNTTYSFTANGENGEVYIRSSNPLVGYPIPASTTNLTGICSQFASSYQLLPRDSNDITVTSSLSFTVSPFSSNISTTGFDINWETNQQTNAFVNYGLTPLLELGILSGTTSSTSQAVSITGGMPSQLYYAQAFSVSGTDTLFGAVQVYITASVSSGNIKVYFSRGVDNTKANNANNLAVSIPNAFDDTIATYILNAGQSVDVAIYNFSDVNTALLVQALNTAHTSGRQVRVITENSNANLGIAALNPGIPVIESPGGIGFGIMHNKFVIIDASSASAMDDIVITGSTNWTDDQLTIDRNNLVIVQDKSLATAYTLEFEEMWGSSGAQPDTTNSRFGPDKLDDTPHFFNINGNLVKCYFSPSDNTNNQIIEAVNLANTELYFALLSFTRQDIAQAISDRIINTGAYAAGIVNDTSSASATPFNIIYNTIGSNMQIYDAAALPGIMHHKYLIVDQGNATSDPLVLTGSHNWSTSANSRNDENTLIIHNEDIANQYYQEFVDMMDENGVAVSTQQLNALSNLFIYPNPSSDFVIVQFKSDQTDDISFTVSDISGKIIYSYKENIKSGFNVFSVPLNDLSNGIYILQMQSTNGNAVNKIIKQ